MDAIFARVDRDPTDADAAALADTVPPNHAGPSEAHDALQILVQHLARQAARELFASAGQNPISTEPGDR